MINIYFSQGVVSKVVWSIMKGSSGVPEDFSRAVVKVWLISEDDKINASAETTVEDGKIVIDLSAVNHSIDYPLLPANVYSMKALWWKDENMQKLSVAEVHNAFAVTSYQEEATPFTGDELTIRVKSPAATYGYDGLSAYEIACMRGTTTALSEKEYVQVLTIQVEEVHIAEQAITTPKLANGAVTTDKIQDFDDSATDPTGVTTDKLADSAVTTPKIANSSVTTDKVADAAVTTTKIADGAVTTAKILDGNVTRDKINTSAVATEKIANEAVTTAKIADGAVTTAKLADGSVTEDKLADDAVTTDKIHDGAVTTGKIENSAITTDKLHDAAITNQKIANGTLTGAKFVDGSITGEKIADNTVPGSKLQDGTITGVDLQDNSLPGRKLVDSSVDGVKIADGAIESRHLKDNSIPAEKIKDGTIENVDIKDGTLSGEKIKDNTIQSAKFADGAIGTSKIVDNSVTTDKLDSGAVTAAKIVDGAVTSGKINSGAVTTGKIADEAVTEDKLADGAVTTAKLSDGMIEEIQTITDAEPTSGSVKPVQSGGVQNELALGAVYDVSAKNPTAGPNSDGKWESLSALLSDANLNTLIPTAYRKGGMSVKFVQSSDNKYVQHRLMLSTFNNAQFTNPINWERTDNGANSVVSKELLVSSSEQKIIAWQDGLNTGTHLGDTVVVKVNSNTAILTTDDNSLRLQFIIDGSLKSTYINETTPYMIIDGVVIGTDTTDFNDVYDLKVFTDANTVATAGTAVVEVLTGQKARNFYNSLITTKNTTDISTNSAAILENASDIKKMSVKISDNLITNPNKRYTQYGNITNSNSYGCTDKIKLSNIKGIENGLSPIKGVIVSQNNTPSIVFFREDGTSVAGTYIGLVNERESIPASYIPSDAVYAGFNTYLPYSPDGLLIDGFGIPAEIKTIDDKVIDLTDEINISNQTSENYIHLVSGIIDTSTGAYIVDNNRCRVDEFIELDSVGEFYYLHLFIGNDRYSGTRIFYDANKEVTTQENAVFERAYFNVPLPSDMYNVSVVGTTGLLKCKEFNVGKYYHVLNQHNSVDIINDSRVDIALGKLESDGSYADEMAASPIVNDEGNAYVGFRTETKASKRDYQSLRIVAINHDDAPESDVIGNRKIYNKYRFNASFNYILMPFGNTDTKFKKVKNVKQMLAEGHDLGLHAIMNSSYWITNFMFDVTPNSSTLFAPTVVDLQGDEADHTGTNAFGRSVSLSTNMNAVGFADLPSELANLKVVELDNQTWISVIRKYNLYCDDSVISGLDLNDNIVSKTRLGWLEYWYNELIDSSLGYSSDSNDIATKFAADYSGTYPTKEQVINGNIAGVGSFTKGLFKGCASCCNYEVMDKCIEVAKAFVLHYYGSCNFKSFHTHGVQYFRYGYISSENNCLYCDSDLQVLLNNRQKVFFSRTRRFKSLNDVLVSYGMRTTAHYENVGAACLLEGQKDLYFGYADFKPAFFSDGGLNADYLNFFGTNAASGGMTYANFNTFLEGLDNWLKFAFENAGESVTRNGLTYTVFTFIKNTILRIVECEGTGRIPVLSFDTIRFDPAASTAIDLLLKWLYKNNYKVVTLEEARSIASSHNREYKANYFPNPTFKQSLIADFEGSSTSEDAYIPDGWSHSRGTLNNMSVQVETVDGVNSNAFTFESDGSLNILNTKIYGLTAGKYKLSFYAKGSGSTAQVFKVLNGDFIDGSRTPILNVNTSSAWQKYEVEFTIDEPIRKLTNDAISIICDGYQDNVAYIQVMLGTGNTDNISIARPEVNII